MVTANSLISSSALFSIFSFNFWKSLGLSLESRAANSVDFCIEFKLKFEFSLFYEFEFSLFYEFEFDIFIFASSSSSSSPVKIYQGISSSENKVIDLA